MVLGRSAVWFDGCVQRCGMQGVLRLDFPSTIAACVRSLGTDNRNHNIQTQTRQWYLWPSLRVVCPFGNYDAGQVSFGRA